MSKKYLLLCVVALFVISGCIDRPQTQAEKVGWNQAKYEEYSAIYDLRNEYKLSPLAGPFSISDTNNINSLQIKASELQALLIEIPQDGSTFETTWYIAFSYYALGLNAEVASYNSQTYSTYGGMGSYSDTNQARRWREKASEYYDKSLEYRQQIEDMKPKK